MANKILIPSLKSRIHPEYMTTVLKNRENKSRLIELIFDYIKTNALECFEQLASEEIVLASEDNCVSILLSNGVVTIATNPQLISNHDEGDTKVILHARYILNTNPNSLVTIRSPSGDTDVLVLIISHLHKYGVR